MSKGAAKMPEMRPHKLSTPTPDTWVPSDEGGARLKKILGWLAPALTLSHARSGEHRIEAGQMRPRLAQECTGLAMEENRTAAERTLRAEREQSGV